MILADEPVASLDPVLAHSIMQYLEILNQEDKMTIVCSLHYLDLVQRYSTQVIGLRQGEIVYQGSRANIQAMTDDEFKDIYGEEAERVGGGLEGELQMDEEVWHDNDNTITFGHTPEEQREPSLVPPVVAAIASLIIPGLGQVLARAVRRGLILFVPWFRLYF